MIEVIKILLYVVFIIIKVLFFVFLIILPIGICCDLAERKKEYNSAMDGEIKIRKPNEICDSIWTRKNCFNYYTPYDYVNYEYKVLKEFPYISFSRFYNFYCVNPDSWSIEKYRVYKDNDGHLSFVFEYREWVKYDKWRKQMEKEKELIALNKKNQEIAKKKDETTIKILESVQKDIDAAFNESKKRSNEAKEIVIEVAKNLS